MQFKAFEDGVEVNGRTVYALIDGLGGFKSRGERFMSQVGIGEMQNGKWVFDKNAWYPQQAWLDGFSAIAKELGDVVIYRIGYVIPFNAEFPPCVTDIHSAIRSIDVAYHINHRKNGAGCLYDASTDTMLEGIGHYGYEQVPGQNLIVSVSSNPYPCVFDRGIISAMARKFDANAMIVHDDSKPCRKNGADTCTYLISW